MAKKTKKQIKDLKKAIGELQEQNEAISEKLIEALESQAREIHDIKTALESQSEAADQPEDEPEAAEITEAAERRAGELGVDLSEVEGTGAEGRILVKDVEDAAGSEE